MKLSELIDELENIKKNEGDIQCVMQHYDEFGFLTLDIDVSFYMIERDDKQVCVIGYEDYY